MTLYRIYTSYMMWDMNALVQYGYVTLASGNWWRAIDRQGRTMGRFNLLTKRGYLLDSVQD